MNLETDKETPLYVIEDLSEKGVRAAAYVRVSTERQAQHGFSIEAQKEELRKLAKKRGVSRIFWVIDEALSGRDFDKRKVDLILNLAAEKVIHEVLVVEVDRIGRNCRKLMEVFLDLRDYDVLIVTPTGEIDVDELTGLVMAAIKSWAAQYENERRARAAVAGRMQAFRQKRWNKSIPIGYRKKDGGWIERDPNWSSIIEKIFTFFIGSKNYKSVADIINKEYTSLLNNKQLTRQQIAEILSNPVYIGKPAYSSEKIKKQFGGDVFVDDPALAYVGVEAFRKAEDVISRIYERHRRRKRIMYLELIDKYGYEVLRFIPNVAVICDNCGKPMKHNGLANERSNNFLCPICGKQLRVPKKKELKEIDEWASKYVKQEKNKKQSRLL